jgi:hypothetical protein
MNYNALIQTRKSVREFSERQVAMTELAEIEAYYRLGCRRLVPELKTSLMLFNNLAQKDLEGTAGYENLLIGGPHYLLLLSEPGENAVMNGGYMMEDIVLKLCDMGLGSCWLTFADGEDVKKALKIDNDKILVAMIAFGYEKKAPKRLRFNIRNMSNVDITAERQYYSPKKGVSEIVFHNEWGNSEGVNDLIGFHDDMLWNAFYAASLSPSYLNRQPYGFVLHDKYISLVRVPDTYTDEVSAQLGLGIVMLHFSAVASQWLGKVTWELDAGESLPLPEGYRVAAWCGI